MPRDVVGVLVVSLVGWMALCSQANADPVRPWRNLGWPGGDALMVCGDVDKRLPGIPGVYNGSFWLEIEGGLVRMSRARRGPGYDLERTQVYLLEEGFSATVRLISVRGRPTLTFVANFRDATLTVSAESIFWMHNRDVGAVRISCEVLHAPPFAAEEKAPPSLREVMARRLRALAAGLAPEGGAAPDPALLARGEEDVRAAAEAARDAARAAGSSALGDLPYFAESAAGREHARSPSGRAITLGHPAAICPAVGRARSPIAFSALAEAYEVCLAALPEAEEEAEGDGCACAAATVGRTLLADPAEFAYAARPAAVLATASAEGEGLATLDVFLSGDPEDPAGLRIEDADGREVCAGLRTGAAEAFELRCLRFGQRFETTAEVFGRRGMRGFGAALGIDARRAEDDPRRLLILLFNFGADTSAALAEALPGLWEDEDAAAAGE